MPIVLSELSAREALSAIYIGYYDRAADPAGLAFWEDVVDQDGFNLTSITTLFASASETATANPFFAEGSTVTANTFITSLYLNLFNRVPDAAGLAFWSEQLENSTNGVEGAPTVGQIVTNIIEGAQSEAEGGFPDEEIIRNKIEVALDWTASAESADIEFDDDARDSAASIIEGVDETQASVDAAMSTTDAFFTATVAPVAEINLTEDRDNLTGTAASEEFHAEDGDLQSGDSIDGGAGRDALTLFMEANTQATSPRTTNVETVEITNQQNDGFDGGDNNIAGFENDNGFGFGRGIDVELDAGRMVGVDRWENFDSRADVVIEDARDNDDTNGTFTGDITVAMVSTDPGNVDYAVYFDQPVNTSANDDAIFIEVIDQNNSAAFSAGDINGSTEGNLDDAQLDEFSILIDGARTTVVLDEAIVGTDHFGEGATYTDLLNAINTALDNTTLADGSIAGDDLTATLGSTFDENIGDDNTGAGTNSQVFGLQIVLRSDSGKELEDAGARDIVVTSREDPADTAQSITNSENIIEELIRLNVEFDDVGKGSTGGDVLFGAMSTGRQTGDDATSDSIGIQQFDIEVDRSSNVQTINSTNNSLEVVNITNGANGGTNNTTTAADENIGDLTVRGQANPPQFDEFGNVLVPARDTDGALPGGTPQHNQYGFSDVRVINAAAMIGAVDLTAELTAETVEKYLNIQDSQANGELDDIAFNYTLGSNDDEFFLNMSSAALNEVGTGSREDFDMSTRGGAGDDVITTNVGTSVKTIDAQGQDHYIMTTDNMDGWYQNSVFNNAASFTVTGGADDDTIWTHGWGDSLISDGTGRDAVYTDNSGVAQLSELLPVIDRNLLEHDPIDYVVGAAWALNAEGALPVFSDDNDDTNDSGSLTGITNNSIVLATAPAGVTSTTLSNGQATITVSFTASGGDVANAADGVYTVNATIPVSQLSVTAGGNVITTEQAYNQAIKAAINENQTLSQVLEAVDGPGNSLIVYSKIDGDYVGTEFGVEFTSLVVNGSADLIAGSVVAPGYAPADTEFQAYSTASTAESDNRITVAADGDNDVFVLSTNDAGAAFAGSDGTVRDANTDLDNTSNEVLRFTDGNFGSDTVVNFDAGAAAAGNGHDVMDFLAIDYDAASFSNGTFSGLANGVSLEAETGANNELSEVATAHNGMATGTGTAETIAIVYDANDDNRGTVYLVTDTVGSNATATLLGDIELIGTDWSTLTVDNFA